MEKVVELLRKTIPDVRHRFDVLAEKSLIYMKNPTYVDDIMELERSWVCIRMHTLLEKLGRDIVRNKFIDDPGQRQFLVDDGEICDVLMDDAAGSRNIIGITYNAGYNRDGELNLSERSFEKLSNLQFLEFKDLTNICLPDGLSYLSPQLRLLHWESFQMTCLPPNFDPKFLVELNMRFSKLEKLWEGTKLLPNLKWMDLSYSKHLKELPNLSTAAKLQKLNLKECSSLVELPCSIGHATSLRILNLCDCSSLVELPSSFGNAITNLQTLDFGGCSSLAQIPSFIGNAITNLQRLYFDGCSSLAQIPSFIGNATHLTSLSFDGCSSLVEVPAFIGNLHKLISLTLRGCSKLEVLPVNVNLESLDSLDFSGCSSLKSFPEISTNICFVLNLSGTAIKEVPPSVKGFSRLRRLVLCGCKELVSLPQLPDSLKRLIAADCESLERLDFSSCNPDIDLKFGNCFKLGKKARDLIIPENCGSLESLDFPFYNPYIDLNFGNCFKLNKEARDLIIQTSNKHGVALLPGTEIPTYFTHRGKGGSLKVELNERPFPLSLRFKACILLVKNEERVLCDPPSRRLLDPLTEHLYIFEFEEASVTWNEIFFEFWTKSDGWVIKECGVHIAKKKKNEGVSVDEEDDEGESVDEEEENEGERM